MREDAIAHLKECGKPIIFFKHRYPFYYICNENIKDGKDKILGMQLI